MAVTHNTKSKTIRGITYAYGGTFVCYASKTGNAGSEGNGDSAKALTVGDTYTFKGYATDDYGNLTAYPYLVADSLGNNRGWFKENIFPYAKYKILYDKNCDKASNVPGSQTKTYGTDITISSTTPTRTGYTFNGWNTKADGSGTNYAAGATYSANAGITLYAKWKANTYTVSYNANGTGVSNMPGNQTKTYGTTLTLSSAKPTRANYTFKGWGTSAGATTVAYSPGASYTKNEKLTLYAIWELAYTKPRIKNFSVTKSDASGNPNENGTHAVVDFDWECDYAPESLIFKWKLTTQKTWATESDFSRIITGEETHGSFSTIIGGSFSTMSSYIIEVTIADSHGSTTKSVTLNSLSFTIHAKEGGDGVAFGKTAELSDTADFNFKGKFRKEVNFDQNVMFGNKNGYLDGNTGVYINKAGYMHLQRATTDGNPYIGFYVDNVTSANAQIVYKNADKYLHFTNATRYAFDHNVQTQKSIYMGMENVYNDNNTENDNAHSIVTKWKDNSNHNIVERYADGLTSAFGWSGNDSYSTKTILRGQSVFLRGTTVKLQDANGTTVTSDERLKKDFTELDKWSAFYYSLEPIAFKMKNGNSGRYHIGFKAQQVEQALLDAGLTTQDFAGFIKSKYIVDNDDPEGSKVYEEVGIKPGDDEYGLIYTEFVALNTCEIQKLRKKNDELEKRVESLEERLKALEMLVNK